MDTITQALLGGAIGYLVAGKTAPRKAVLWGAAIAVLPDLDVFIPYDTDLDAMTHHRSWTHSWLVQSAFAPLFAAVIHRFDKSFSFRNWWLLFWLALITHSGLDALTVYGTQLFWPFMPAPVSGGSIFIIDPVYSLPLLLGFLLILFKPGNKSSQRLMRYSFIFSCLYLSWGWGVQQWMTARAEAALAEQQISYSHIQVSATAFNTLLWRVLVMSEDHYHEGFRSIFEADKPFVFQAYPRGSALLELTRTLPAFKRINWFTHGLFKLEQHGEDIIASDLRMGMEPSYFFRFRLAQFRSHDIIATPPNRVITNQNRKTSLRWLWQRLWCPTLQLKASSGST